MMSHQEMTEHILPSDDNQMYTAEYKDGQLHIVEVSPYDKREDDQIAIKYETNSILPGLASDDDDDGQTKYLHLDVLNFTVVKNADGMNTYQMVSSDTSTAEDGDTITCVLSTDDVDDADNQESYVMLQTDDEQVPCTFLQPAQTSHGPDPSTMLINNHQPETIELPLPVEKPKAIPLTPVEILEKAKALQKAKAFLASSTVSRSKRGRKRKSDLPPPIELLTSPNFKLYLYSCKLCSYKCNAVKEMSAHKKSEHAAVSKGGNVIRAACLQCARCPYRGNTQSQLINHVSRTHARETEEEANEFITALQLDSEEVQAADVLVCGACGFESGDRPIFKKHIEDEHGAITSVV